MLSRVLKKIVHEVQLRSAISDPYWLQKLKYFGLTELAVYVSPDGGLVVEPLGIKLSPERHLFMLEGYCFAKALADIGARFHVDNSQRVRVHLGGLCLNVSSRQELFILDEIYVKNCYNYKFHESSIVIDIGFNVGFSALYFAQDGLVDRIYAFEPFSETFEQGQKNLNLNPDLKHKIVARNYGLAAKSRELVAEFNSREKGNNKAAPFARVAGRRGDYIALRGITGVLDALDVMSSGMSIVLKMDCEGGEYELIEQLDADGLLPGIEALMIEWHVKGPEIIERVLQKNGFSVFSTRESVNLGFIYATRGVSR